MANVIVLTQAERDAVVGPSAVRPNCVLDPIALTDGTFYVGVEVLTDVVFSSAKYAAMKLKTPVDFSTIQALLPPSTTHHP